VQPFARAFNEEEPFVPAHFGDPQLDLLRFHQRNAGNNQPRMEDWDVIM
jgi:hypothetical protein